MHVTGGSGDRHDAEVDEVVLVEPEEAIRRVNYDGEREVIKQLIDKGDQGRGKVCWGSVAKVATVGAAVVFVVWWRA